MESGNGIIQLQLLTIFFLPTGNYIDRMLAIYFQNQTFYVRSIYVPFKKI